MKVLQINSVCGIRSTGKICKDLAAVLKAQGHDSLVLYGRENAPEKFASISKKITTDTEVKLHALSARLFDKAGFASNGATKRFIKEIERYNPDIIHLHNLHGYYINAEMLFDYLKSQSRPVVWTLHDCWAFTGHCSHFSYARCDRWKSGCHDCPQKLQYPKSFFDNSRVNYERKKKCFSGVKNLTVVTPSSWLADLVRESFLSEYPVSVIPNGIDLASFKPTHTDVRKKYGIGDGKIILGVASVWSERKGLSDFIKLSELISDEYKIVLVGVNDSLKKELPKNIIAISATDSREELAAIYTEAYVFYNPTYEDNYPTVNLEAQACGTPVITYRTGGSMESVPKENVVAQGDLSAVINMLGQEIKIKEQDFSQKCMVERYVRLIFEMCSRRYEEQMK